MKKLSYVLLGDPVAWDKSKTKAENLHSGLWQWRRAFDKDLVLKLIDYFYRTKGREVL